MGEAILVGIMEFCFFSEFIEKQSEVIVEVAELRLTLGSLLTTMVLTGRACCEAVEAAAGSLAATTLEFPPPPPFWLTMTTVVAVVLAAVAEVFSE